MAVLHWPWPTPNVPSQKMGWPWPTPNITSQKMECMVRGNPGVILACWCAMDGGSCNGSCRASLYVHINGPVLPTTCILFRITAGFWGKKKGKKQEGEKQDRKLLIFLSTLESNALELGIICNLEVLQSSIKGPRWRHSSRGWVGFHSCSSLLEGRAQL